MGPEHQLLLLLYEDDVDLKRLPHAGAQRVQEEEEEGTAGGGRPFRGRDDPDDGARQPRLTQTVQVLPRPAGPPLQRQRLLQHRLQQCKFGGGYLRGSSGREEEPLLFSSLYPGKLSV